VEIPWQPLLEGDTSRNLRVIRYAYSGRKLQMIVEGLPERRYIAHVHTPWRAAAIAGGRIQKKQDSFHVAEIVAPAGPDVTRDKAGYTRWTFSVQFEE
jgi:hypothetical protein